MGIGRVQLYRCDGRILGSFCYMVLCHGDGSIYLKIGHSREPIVRLNQIRTGCPLEPRILAYCHLPSHEHAVRVEAALHTALDKWRIRGEWFSFKPLDKKAFNDSLNSVLTAFAKPSWPLKWVKLSARALMRQAAAKKGYYYLQYRRRGKAYQDFVKHCN